jgi:hypothetical protein
LDSRLAELLSNIQNNIQPFHIHDILDLFPSSSDRDLLVGVPTPDPSPCKPQDAISLSHLVNEDYRHLHNGMPSPMDECDNLMNIHPSQSSDASVLKRKLDGTTEELAFPCKKVSVSLPDKANVMDLDVTTIPTMGTPTKTTMTPTKVSSQVKLSKAEREALKLEKAKERDLERQKREAEKLKREEERVKREEEKLRKEEERVKKVVLCD